VIQRKQRIRRLFLVLFSFIISLHSHSQNIGGLIAKYYFNEGKAENDLTDIPVKVKGIVFCADRFGNSESACCLLGNNSSYLNLGTSQLLKPATGSIALWIKITAPIYSGQGFSSNPVVMTKCCPGDDFFEGYNIGYNFANKKLYVSCAFDNMNEPIVMAQDSAVLEKWYHLVMTYDDQFMTFYIDGKPQGKVPKNFRSKFLPGDSVMIGNSANHKNSRYFCGKIDDISFYNRVLSEEEINTLFNEPDPNKVHRFFKLASLIIIIIAGISLIIVLIIRRFKRALEKEKAKSLLQSQLYEMEMKVIKAQMNPHFIFNSMNSIQHLMLSKDIESANTYLVKFSRLLRKILESNTEEFISIENEIDILNKYIEIESLRFQHAFTYEIIADENPGGSHIRIPQMMIQPFVENAIWHGLLPKKGNGKLTITFGIINDKILSCIIDDNGVGRNSSSETEIVEKNKSLGIIFIKQRLELMKKIWGGDYSLTITDKTSSGGTSEGTRITILIPIHYV
jgi:hypothetical protein